MVFLIVDDNARMRASIKRFLLTRIPDHHAIHEAADGAEAIALYERERPDWVLMDIVMGPVDGLAAARAIIAAHPEAKVIILTSFDDERYRRTAREAGTKAYLLKEHLNDIPSILSEEVP